MLKMNIKTSNILFLLILAVSTASAAPDTPVDGALPHASKLPANARVPDAAITLFKAAGVTSSAHITLPGVARSRPINIQTETLHKSNLQAGARIVFDTFDGDKLVGVIERVNRRDSNKYSWVGRLVGQPDSSFNIVIEDDVMVGNINPVGMLPFEIRYSGTGSEHTLREVKHDPSIGCGVEPKHHIRSAPPSASPLTEAISDVLISPDNTSLPDMEADSGAFIDVLFVYTTGAETAAGGQSAIHAIVQLSVDTSNTAYSLSNVSQRIRLAGRRSTTYSEAGGSFDGHLFRIRNNGDNIMDDVHDWRNDYRADLVALIVDDTDGGTTFGLAYVIGGPFDEELGFSVTDQAFAASAQNWSLAHELGHNMGSLHDQVEGGTGGITSYAFGHPFTGDTQGLLRTIMGSRALGGTRIQRFSNPSVNFDGQPTGIAIGQANEADIRSAFAVSDYNVANYRAELPATVWVDFGHPGPFFFGTSLNPFNNMVDAESRVRWNGTIIIKASSYTGGAAYTLGTNKAYRINTDGGGNVFMK